jgi:hypothetical protein
MGGVSGFGQMRQLALVATAILAGACGRVDDAAPSEDTAVPDAGEQDTAVLTDFANDYGIDAIETEGAVTPDTETDSMLTPGVLWKGYPISIAVDDDAIWWTGLNERIFYDGGPPATWSVLRLPKSGGAFTFDLSEPGAQLIALDDGHVYWTIQSSIVTPAGVVDAVRVMAKTGGSATTIASPKQAGAIATDGGWVYFVDIDAGTIQRIRPDGTGMTTVVSGDNAISNIAIDAGWLYWLHSAPAAAAPTGGAVFKVAVDGGTPVAIASHLDWPAGLAIAADHVIWAGGVYPGDDDDPLWTTTVDGGPPAVFSPSEWLSGVVAIDGGDVFWLRGRSGTEVRTLPLSGGTARTVTVTPNGLNALALDATHVYWGGDALYFAPR